MAFISDSDEKIQAQIEDLRGVLLKPDALIEKITPIINEILANDVDEIRQMLLEPDTMVDKITPVISQVLAAEIANSRDKIAVAIAPILGEALRRQIYQAREDIIDALYPVIGQMVNKAVTEAIHDFARDVDNRIRKSTNLDKIVQHVQAHVQGVSYDEYQLRESLPFIIEEVFLIHRVSGLLIHYVSKEDDAISDRDIVSGMLTAVRDFARDTFQKGGELGSLGYFT